MWNCHKNKEVEPVQAIQTNIYQNKTYVLEMSQGFKRTSSVAPKSYTAITVAYPKCESKG